jgi:hypothetical protein
MSQYILVSGAELAKCCRGDLPVAPTFRALSPEQEFLDNSSTILCRLSLPFILEIRIETLIRHLAGIPNAIPGNS